MSISVYSAVTFSDGTKGISITHLDPKPTHPKHVGGGGRQNCCHTCHDCLAPLKEVLDGEQWCALCERYV